MKKLLTENINGKTNDPKTLFEINRKDNLIYAHFEASDSSLESYSNIHNDKLYDGNVVEIFLDIGKESYIEIEVAPNGTTFVATILNRAITFIDDSFLKTNVRIKGQTYIVDLVIDLSTFGNPKEIRYNAFRIEVIEGKQTLLAVNPTLCSTFHVKDKFIIL